MIFADFELYEYLSDKENLVAQESASVLYFVESTLYSGRRVSRAEQLKPPHFLLPRRRVARWGCSGVALPA